MKKFIYSLVLCALAAMPAVAQETITVHDGNATNNYVPVYGFYADAYNKCEMIMPADDLSEMTGATITKMTWYLTSPAADSWASQVLTAMVLVLRYLVLHCLSVCTCGCHPSHDACLPA